MLISPPFLSTPQGNTESHEDYVARNMQGGVPGDGAFPISFEFKWHGGIHLDASNDLARAIADGTIKYLRRPRTNCKEDDPLDYYKGWTSDGVVVIEHKTEIGENVEVTYYSVYMHLSAIADGVKGGQPIYRKDEVGRAGYIYGEPNKLHFEICCDHENLKKLIGRNSGKLDIGHDGRTDSLWGDMYFALPVGTKIYGGDMVAAQKTVNAKAAVLAKAQERATQAANRATQAEEAATTAAQAAAAAPGNVALAQQKTKAAQDANKAQQESTKAQNVLTKAQADATQAANDYAQLQQAAPAHTTTQPLFVGMAYERGNCTLTTYDESGNVVAAVPAAGYEYDLYKEATDLYPECASAGYELLRFGRVVGPDALRPADAAHWRKIGYIGGQGWVNLKPDVIKKFSDADFPHWRGWTLVDDDTRVDSRCDSSAIKALVLEDGQAHHELGEAANRLKDPKVRQKLKRTICKLPSEWDPTDIDTRWGWLKQDKPEEYSPLLNKCMSSEAFDKLKAHIQALAFWDKAGMGSESYWYFNPEVFIAIFRKCGWLSLHDMTQLLPAKSQAGGSIPWDRATNRLTVGYKAGNNASMPANIYLAINKGFRKYLVLTTLRQAHFFGQMLEETGALTLNTENGNERYFRTMYEIITPQEAGEDYDNKGGIAWRLKLVYKNKVPRAREEYVTSRPREVAEKARSLGNTKPGDGPRFRGRGLIQVTGRNNYELYGKYRGGKDFVTDPNPQLLADDAFVSADLSLKYWVSKYWVYSQNPGVHKGLDINQLADAGYDDTSTKGVTIAINGGTTGIDHRREYFNYAFNLLCDLPTPLDTTMVKRQKEPQ